MKARVIATGEIKSFYPTRQSGYNGYVDEQGQWYYPHELDFRNGGILLPEKEIVIDTIWLAILINGGSQSNTIQLPAVILLMQTYIKEYLFL